MLFKNKQFHIDFLVFKIRGLPKYEKITEQVHVCNFFLETLRIFISWGLRSNISELSHVIDPCNIFQTKNKWWTFTEAGKCNRKDTIIHYCQIFVHSLSSITLFAALKVVFIFHFVFPIFDLRLFVAGSKGKSGRFIWFQRVDLLNARNPQLDHDKTPRRNNGILFPNKASVSDDVVVYPNVKTRFQSRAAWIVIF